ncbi:MAG: 4-hydroxy-tetrahydrodipicolinate synthase [Clostridia bacterium]|nr:4-hydroxy-tetrahydrodipicolinate synthase [Oscillospiraceae bacterium]MBQ2746382.1 4-hydroxy-tetrahydrodipicolinate synthase [Clostridia bacterium]
MKKRVFTGVATALVTPMFSDGTVNYEALDTIIEDQIQKGVDALVICGTTGEAATLNHEDHVKVIAAAVKKTAGRIPIIAGTGSNDTAYSVELSNEALAVGADALLLVTPYYNKTSQAGLIAHYTYIADRVDAPIILYNVPSRTGVNILPETYAQLAKHPNIVAAKEANGDIASVIKTRALCGDNLDIYSGNDDQIIPIMSVGGIGVISVLSNVAPTETHNMCQLYLDGKVKEAADMQIKYIDLINALFSDVNPIPVKEAMDIMGYEVGPCRLPLVKMSDAKHEALKAELKKVNLI